MKNSVVFILVSYIYSLTIICTVDSDGNLYFMKSNKCFGGNVIHG